MISVMVIFWRWYYGEAVKDLLMKWKNFVIFSLEYFSIPLLLKTLFAPWKRDITRKPRGLDLKKLFEYITFNLISRSIGFIIRFLTICVGILFFFFVAIAGAMFFIIWIFLPLIFIGLLILAIILLI